MLKSKNEGFMSSKFNVYVEVKDNDNIGWALKKFKRQCDVFGVTKEYRKRKYYRKPSIQAKEKTEAALKRRQKEARKKRRGSKI